MSLSGRDWNTCLNHCLPPSKGQKRFRRQLLLLNHRPHRCADAQTAICPVRVLRFYIDRSSSFRQSIQLLGAMLGVRRPEPYRKQSLSHWIVDAITEAYTTQGLENALCTLGAVQRGLSFHLSMVKMYVYSRYCLAAGGLRRIPSPGFTSWTFSP